jgi:hypothetical protein
VDPGYQSLTPPGAKITISSTAGQPTTLIAPKGT